MRYKFGIFIIVMLICSIVFIAFRSQLHNNETKALTKFIAMPVTNVIVKASDKLPIRMRFESPKVNPSDMVYIICGLDSATADRYEERNRALKSISLRRDLPYDDVISLMAYVCSTNDTLKIERSAALKNDVLNLLRSQESPPAGLSYLLMDMFNSGIYEPVILDYCIQHLGGLQHLISDKSERDAIRTLFESAAADTHKPYAGTALYALADERNMNSTQRQNLRNLTIAACNEQANTIARIAAIQLAGQRGYTEALPILREVLRKDGQDAVLRTVAIGSIGLLGSERDLPLIESMALKGGVRFNPAIEAATNRIKARSKSQEGLSNAR